MHNLILTEDGSHTLLNEQWQVTYHSKFGALQEADTVYISAGFKHLLNKLLGENPQLSVLEMGLGTGLNAFMTYVQAIKYPHIKIKYTGVDAYPISPEMAAHFNYTEALQLSEYQDVFLKLHQPSEEEWQALSPNFLFRRIAEQFESLDFGTQLFDLIYYDAFAPNAQPELWDEAMMRKIFNLLRPNGVMTTYCAKGDFKRLLRSIGFVVEALPGPKGKREMTRATKPFM
jgi:tRNA U34 5-methylaminomethyl-2-thiouridine-forming methyltransferase MnmC